jgi:hypothetical protein
LAVRCQRDQATVRKPHLRLAPAAGQDAVARIDLLATTDRQCRLAAANSDIADSELRDTGCRLSGQGVNRSKRHQKIRIFQFE